jgi:hypothetical protein
MAMVERVEQSADLIPVPDAVTLKLLEGHVTAIDVVEDGRALHGGRILLLAPEAGRISPPGIRQAGVVIGMHSILNFSQGTDNPACDSLADLLRQLPDDALFSQFGSHIKQVLSVRSSCIMPCLRLRALVSLSSTIAISVSMSVRRPAE